MKKQLNIFSNEARVTLLEQKEITSIRIKEDESKEYLTTSGKIVIVTKKCKCIQGTGFKKHTYFQINDFGKILEPFMAIGVKNYLKRN